MIEIQEIVSSDPANPTENDLKVIASIKDAIEKLLMLNRYDIDPDHYFNWMYLLEPIADC